MQESLNRPLLIKFATTGTFYQMNNFDWSVLRKQVSPIFSEIPMPFQAIKGVVFVKKFFLK
jgi:hypothetical protein